jgi:hypothetical protein
MGRSGVHRPGRSGASRDIVATVLRRFSRSIDQDQDQDQDQPKASATKAAGYFLLSKATKER